MTQRPHGNLQRQFQGPAHEVAARGQMEELSRRLQQTQKGAAPATLGIRR